jgi:hypothetical protein
MMFELLYIYIYNNYFTSDFTLIYNRYKKINFFFLKPIIATKFFKKEGDKHEMP